MFKAFETLNDLTSKGFRAIEDGDVEHFAAIGRLILAMSTNVDGNLKTLLQFQLGIHDDVARRALLGEMRMDSVVAAIRRIATSQRVDALILKELFSVLEEVQLLRQVRDILAHRECMVAGDKLAFHNANHAKAEAAIDVDIYSISDLNELSAYATRIRYRIMSLFAKMLPKSFTHAQQAYLTMAGLNMALIAANAILKKGGISEIEKKEVQAKSRLANEAVVAYSNAARGVDAGFVEKERAANSALFEYAAFLASVMRERKLQSGVPESLRKRQRKVSKKSKT